MKRFLLALFWVSGLLVAGRSYAAVTVNISESGSSVTVNATGTLSTSGLTYIGSATCNFLMDPSSGRLEVGPNVTFCDIYGGASSLNSFGTGAASGPPDSGADYLGTFGGSVYVPFSFTTGGAINATSTFLNSSFSSLGLTEGTYTVTWSGDSITLIVGSGIPPSAVPTLSEWAQLMLALMVIGVAWRFNSHRQNNY